MQIYIHKQPAVINNFHFQEGHVSWIDTEGIIYAACDSLRDYHADSFDLLIYRLTDGSWVDEWANSMSIPKVIEAIKAYRDEKAMDTAVLEAEKLDAEHNLYITDKELRFMKISPYFDPTYGIVSGNYAIYTPTSVVGVYCVKGKTTRSDVKPINYLRHYKALSILEYEDLRKEADKIKDEGMHI